MPKLLFSQLVLITNCVFAKCFFTRFLLFFLSAQPALVAVCLFCFCFSYSDLHLIFHFAVFFAVFDHECVFVFLQLAAFCANSFVLICCAFCALFLFLAFCPLFFFFFFALSVFLPMSLLQPLLLFFAFLSFCQFRFLIVVFCVLFRHVVAPNH